MYKKNGKTKEIEIHWSRFFHLKIPHSASLHSERHPLG